MRLAGVFAVFAFAVLTLAGQETTIKVPVSSEEIAQLTFDRSQVSPKDVQQWMKFHETGQYAEPIAIQMCFSDPGYADCDEAKPEDINLHNAALNLQKDSCFG
jgi:hypothetical protein